MEEKKKEFFTDPALQIFLRLIVEEKSLSSFIWIATSGTVISGVPVDVDSYIQAVFNTFPPGTTEETDLQYTEDPPEKEQRENMYPFVYFASANVTIAGQIIKVGPVAVRGDLIGAWGFGQISGNTARY